ncbi:uncharacterized protein LOC143285647 [Babylonia areolata]|uniref:uncharacterized protein LOC143285647 n=1 Tax=Babylonia areolata TaxID=304850 RepID=UPI003FD2C81A
MTGPYQFVLISVAGVTSSPRICDQRTHDVIFVSRNNSVIVRFVSDTYFFGKGFHLVLTQFRDGPCRDADAEFTCDNGRCVHSDLACDPWTHDDLHLDHCGDRSNRCHLSYLLIICIVVAVIVSIFVFFVVSALVWYRIRGTTLLALYIFTPQLVPANNPYYKRCPFKGA